MVLWLAKGLQELGHEVRLGALAGSTAPPGVILVPIESSNAAPEALLEGEGKRWLEGVDVVHFMAPPSEEVMKRLPVASLLTVHGNGKVGERFPDNTVFLSADHARRHGRIEFVHNGLDPSEYRFDPDAKRDAFLFLSKTSWKVKNVRGALSMCKEAGVPLDVAGGNRPYLPRARAMAENLLPGRARTRWLGPVNGLKKAEILSRARALVFPVLWDEPFGLVVIEALISGTPVIASRRGSMPELVAPTVGVLPGSHAEWIQWLQTARLPFAPEACRAWAMEKFHYLRMARDYVTHYHRVKSKKGVPRS